MLRTGIVGCGKLADDHVSQVRASGRAELVAVCDAEPLMAEQLAVRMNVPARYSDVTQMIAEEKLEVLHIAAPPEAHVALACEAMQAGCHVFLEKPFAPDVSAAQAILDCAAQTDRQVSVNYRYNFEHPALELMHLLATGRLGEIVHLDLSLGTSEPFRAVLDDVCAKVVWFLSEEPHVQATAFCRGYSGRDRIPDELRFTVRSGDVTVNANISAAGRPFARSLRVVGTRDTADLDYRAGTIVVRSDAMRRSKPDPEGGMAVLLSGFYDAVEGKAAAPIPRDHILRVCMLSDRIIEALT